MILELLWLIVAMLIGACSAALAILAVYRSKIIRELEEREHRRLKRQLTERGRNTPARPDAGAPAVVHKARAGRPPRKRF